MKRSSRLETFFFVVALKVLVLAVVYLCRGVVYVCFYLYNRLRGPKLHVSELCEVIDKFKPYGDEGDPRGLRVDFYKNSLAKGLRTKIDDLKIGDSIRIDIYPGMSFKLADKNYRRGSRRRTIIALYMTRKPANEMENPEAVES